MYKVSLVTELKKHDLSCLKDYIETNTNSTPYHLLSFNFVINNSWTYFDCSLVVFNLLNEIVGYIPQWIRQNAIESVPWRDKGGPLYDNESVLILLIDETKKIVLKNKLKGFLWKDFECKYLSFYEYFIDVSLNLENKKKDDLWKKIKNRRNIKRGEKSKLKFYIYNNNLETITDFYSLFLSTRKRLGVPAYQKEFFKKIIAYMNENCIIAGVNDEHNNVLAMLIVLHFKKTAIYAYGASSLEANKFKANEFLMWNMLLHMNSLGFKVFDFGSDSPLQETLIRYKMKWGGNKRVIKTSYYGSVKEFDNNLKKYQLIKKIIRNLPMVLYKMFSNFVVK